MTSRVYGGGREKSDRALELHEKGLPPTVIAERLGISKTHVQGMLQRARQRRENAKESAE